MTFPERLALYEKEWNPHGITEKDLLHTLASAAHSLARLEEAEQNVLQYGTFNVPQDPSTHVVDEERQAKNYHLLSIHRSRLTQGQKTAIATLRMVRTPLAKTKQPTQNKAQEDLKQLEEYRVKHAQMLKELLTVPKPEGAHPKRH